MKYWLDTLAHCFHYGLLFFEVGLDILVWLASGSKKGGIELQIKVVQVELIKSSHALLFFKMDGQGRWRTL